MDLRSSMAFRPARRRWVAFQSALVYKCEMPSASKTTSNLLSAKLLVAVFGVLAFLAAAAPHVPRSQAPVSAGDDLVYDLGSNDLAVLPKLERDQRQRAHPAIPPVGEQPVLAMDLAIAIGAPASGTALVPASAPLRFHHLDERTSPTRAPPILV